MRTQASSAGDERRKMGATPQTPTVGVCLAALAAIAGCSGSDPVGSDPVVALVQVSPSTAGVGAVGDAVAFTATAKDAAGNTIPGVTFSWTSSPSTVATVDAAGVATALVNGSAEIRASAQGVSGVGTLTLVQQPASLAIVGGNGQAGLARRALTAPLRVRVLDARGHPIAGHPVSWQLYGGGGTLVGSSADASGVASATWTMGPVAGPASATASAGVATATFSATALPNGTIEGTVTRSGAYLAPPASVIAAARTLARPTGQGGTRSKVPLASTGPEARFAVDPPRDVPDELLVRLRTTRLSLPAAGSMAYRSAPEAERAAQTMRAAAWLWQREEALDVLGASPAVATVRIRVPPGEASAVRDRLLRRPEVESVEPNGVLWATGLDPLERRATSPAPRGTSYAPAGAANEPYFTRQAWHYDLIRALHAWEVTTGSPNVIVAVVDDGVRFDHPDIAPNLRSDGYDFVSLRTIPGCSSGVYSTSMDGDGPDPDPTIPALLDYDNVFDCVYGPEAVGGHGLHVAGTIGARAGNGSGGVGVAWQVGIRPVRVLSSAGSGTFYDIAQGILYAAGLPADNGTGGTVQATSGADIINLSLGGSTNSAVLQGAVQAASAAGSLLVVAAGNSGTSAPHYPAAYPEVISVSAIAPDLSLASYSSFGSTVDIAAPGGELADGSDYGVWSLMWNFQTNSPTYQPSQGTSMAAPHVSGVAALVLAATPGLTATQLRARLLDHAVDLGAPGVDPSFGAGLVSANASVRNGVGPPRDIHVMAVDAVTGRSYGPSLATSTGAYSIDALPDGAYHLYAGDDRNGDLRVGFFDRIWGALGGSTTPTSVSISQSSIESASFTVGFPLEDEGNGALATANPLPLGGYTYGVISSSSDVDLYRVQVAETTSILVETDGLYGACGLAGQVDTVVRILDGAGNPITENDDIDTLGYRHCSRIQVTLPAGTYHVEVTGWGGEVGYYAVRVGAS